MPAWGAALTIIVLYVLAVAVVNRRNKPIAAAIHVRRAEALPAATRDLEILTWNIGYAGLGADSDFWAAGGRSFRPPPNRASVARNIAGIKRVLQETAADICVLQECSRTSPLNYWWPIWAELQAVKPGNATIWLADVVSRLIPWPLRLEHGFAVLSNRDISIAQSIPLPLEGRHWLGLLRKQYALLVTRCPVADDTRQWVIGDVHLAAFDDEGHIRRRQFGAVVRFAEQEYRKGNWVVIAGDWNMVLGEETFPHKTDGRFLDWIYPLPPDILPEGWRFAFDPRTPTVRTVHQPYVPHDNFVTIIDGFLVSPNVQVTSTNAIDMAFAFTDHHPVLARFTAK